MLYNQPFKDGFKEWVFQPSMLFGSTLKWWGDRGKREKLHEGLDLLTYRTGRNTINHVDEKTIVPVIYRGTVVKIIKDFLGESVFVSHGLFNEFGQQLYTIYGHIKPGSKTVIGETLEETDIIGAVAPAKKHAGTAPHIHISIAWISKEVLPEELDWDMINDNSRVTFLDPLTKVTIPYSVSEKP
jgi:hypothetical protein